MKTILGIATTAALLAGAPLAAQSIDGQLASIAGKAAQPRALAGMRTERAVPKGREAVGGEWRPVTIAYMNGTVAPADRVRTLSLSTPVDWNGDGVQDVAVMANGRNEQGVIVQLGGNKGRVFAMRQPGQWGGRSEIVAAGKRRIAVSISETTVFIVSAESGQPLSYHSKQGD